MKRIVLRVLIAILAFGFGVVVDRVFSRPQAHRRVKQVQPVMPIAVPACPAPTGYADAVYSVIPPAQVIFDYNPRKFDPRGSFFPLTPLPKEFAEVSYFELAIDEEDGEVWGSAYIQAHTDTGYDFPNAQFLLITERRIFFATSASEKTGFAYRFDGEFLANPASRMDSGKAVVRGTLSKSKNGRTVAECKVSFGVQYLGC